MKKSLFLTLLLALLCTVTTWAQFAPTEGKRYALQETTSGLYLDIQTLGVNEANANATTNNISLNAKPCIIYFAKGTTYNTKWTMKNVNGTYAMQASGRDWNATIGTTAYEWTINEPEASIYTIARADGGFVSMDSPTSGSPLFCDKGTGLKFKLVDYDDFQQAAFTMKSPLTGVTQGAIQSSAALNAITTATKILVRSFSGTNSAYLGGATNVTDINSAVLVWEPVTEGTPGTYYLRTTDAESGYIQASTAANATITLGTKTNAQVFVTTAPTTSGSDATYFNGESLTDGADTGNLVRFVQNGQTKWLNVNNSGSAPRLGNDGKGAWTVHNVYLVTDATYLNLKTVSTTAASCQATATEFYIIPSADKYYFQNVADENQYIGYVSGEGTWDVNTNFGVWQILADENNDGFAQVARGDDALKHLGSDEECVVGKGVYNNVDDDCNGWFFNGVYENYTTTATDNGGKYEFTSGKIYTAGPCNKIRFTLTESAAYYKNGANRLSFDSFVLYDINGNSVELYANNITGNNGKVFDNMLDGTSGTYTAGTWDNSSATDDWFEIVLGSDVDLKGGFSFYFQTENTTMNATEFKIELSYETPSDYTFAINNAPDGAVVTFDGNPIATDDKISYAAFDEDLLVATDIQGYTWSVVVDKANFTITLTYTEAPVVVNPAAVVALINRIGGAGTDASFKFVLDPSMNSKKEVFVIGSEEGKILIKGTTISAITTGIGWYLQNYAHINIAWNSLNEKTVSGDAYADLSSLPIPTGEETHTSDAMYRYYLNTCAFGYSMTSWTWKRWQQEIDWMALHGINMPLQLVGLEEVWRKFLTMEDTNGTRKYGYTDEEAKAFVAGPAFIAWWAMNNLQGWGGTAAGTKSGGTWEGAGGVQDDAWYARQKTLANDIVTRQRELGMQPVIPGWSGMVPTNFGSKSGYTTRGNGGNWAGDFVRPLLLSVSNANYAEIAADYYTCLHEVMGESQYYSMDPFHEGGGDGTMEDYEALYAAMEAAKPGSKWVIQQWQWSPTQKYSLTAVPAGRLVVLDLFSDGSPAFDSYSGYAPQDAVFCAIPNFGGRSGIMARLTNLANNYFHYKAKYSSIKGVGAAPEAIEQTPVTYDLIFQLPWMGSQPDVAEWVTNYSIARYGVANAEIQEAWSLLREGPLNYGADGIQGPVEDVWAAKPNLDANAASAWGKTMNHAIGTYTKARHQMLIDATYKLISQSSAIAPGTIYESNYNYDLVEFGGGVLADYAYYLLLGIKNAKNAAGANFAADATYIARRDAFLQLILDVDAFKGTNLNFRLGKWTQEARDAAGEVVGATTATPDWYEYNNARTIVSTWSTPATNLNDYSYRSWQGLMKDLYYPRWKYYFDNNCTDGNYDFFAWNWAHGMEHAVGQTTVSSTPLTSQQAGHTSKYTRDPEGNTLEKAKEVLGKYIIPVVSNTGTYYAYRCLANDLSAVCTVVADAGQTIDLSTYFGELTDVSITGDFIDGTATDIKAVTVKANATDGSHTGTITVADGTVLTFAVVLNPPYNGVYKLVAKSYMDGSGAHTIDAPVFIAYNTDATDNPKSVGYKLMAQGTYSPSDAADDYFTIKPLGAGYSLQAQGLYVKAPQNLANWGHIIASEKAAEAGAYLFEETGTDTGIFKLMNSTGNNKYVNAWDKYIFGNEDASKYSTFTITEVTTYPVTIPANGLAINLPFNVVLPDGVTAYDVVAVGDDELSVKVYETTQLATVGGVVKAGTPMILKATAGDYNLGVTVDNTGAVGSKAGSVLRGNFIKQTLAVNNAINRYTFADATFNLMTTATELAGNSVYMELSEAIDTPIAEGTIFVPEEPSNYPFTLTTDEENPVLYKIISKRADDGSKVLQYDEASKQIAVSTKAANNSYQAWYFTKGTANGQVFAHPYNADGNVIGATNTGNGAGKVSAAGKDAQEYDEWVIVARGEDGYYNINATNGAYLSNYGGESNKMGFWNGDGNESSTQNDNGSLFKFVEAEFENDNPRYYQMKDLNAQLNRYIAGTSVGFYTEESVNAINEKQVAATDLETAGSASSSAADCYAAYKAMREAEDNVEYIEPDPAKLYYIVSAATNDNCAYCAGEYVYTLNTSATRGGNSYDHRHLVFDSFAEITHKQLAAFQFEETGVVGEYKMKSLNSGLYVKSFAGTHMGAEGDAQAVKIVPYATGQLTLKVGNNAPMHAQNTGGVIVQWGAEEGNASLWIINEVAYATDFNYTLTVPANGIATLYLPFNVTLPEGVTAYTIDADDIHAIQDGGYYYEKLTEVAVAGDILAKGTAVIIKAAAGEYTFRATFDDSDAKKAAASALVGTYYKQTISTGYSMAVENNEPIFNRITADTDVEPYSCWLVADGITTDKIGSNVEFNPVVIEDGKVYRIHGRLSNGVLRTLYNDGANKKILWTGEAKSDASTLFIAQAGSDGKFKLVSAVANGYWSQDAKIEENGVELTFVNGSVSNTAMILGENGRRFCADGNDLDFYSNAAGEPASAYVNENVTTDFVFELVEDVTVSYTARIGKGFAYATLYLPYAVTVPDGVTAYIAHTVEGKVIQLTDLQGVIPAKTPVVLKRESVLTADGYVFEYTTDETKVDLTGVNNVLTGYFIETLVEGRDGFRYYMLMKYNTSEKFYWILKEYDSTGKLYTDGEDHTHIKCSGNKAFLEMSESQASSSFSFQFTGTTGIDGVDAEGGNAESIYDLQGRKIVEITEKGVYIINGNKVVVE